MVGWNSIMFPQESQADIPSILANLSTSVLQAAVLHIVDADVDTIVHDSLFCLWVVQDQVAWFDSHSFLPND